MKKYLILSLLFVAISIMSFGQSQRLVLIEEATNASCGPCAAQNPAFDALLQNNTDKVVAIKYHWDFPGYDPMHNHNVSENNARVSYYGINGVPHALIDGSSITGGSYTGAPANCTQAKIDDAYEIPSPFEIMIYQELDENSENIHVSMMIKATENVDAGMKAHMVVIEKLIHFNSSPGSNGETDFHDVMKKMLPNQSGTGLPAFNAGEYKILQYSWELANVYDNDELGVVGFVQNNINQDVLQAGRSSNELFDPLYSSDVELMGVYNVSQNYCVGNIEPHVTIRNNGADVLTSAEITYIVNDESPVTFQWSGNLAFLESETVTLPESDFGVIDMNTLVITIENPNDQTDEYPLNNARTTEIPKAMEADPPMALILKLDNNPEETTWEFTNSQGDVMYEGGPYSTAGEQIFEQYDFNYTDCFTFTIYDAGGDGLTGTGSYKIGFGSTIVAEGSAFGSKSESQFSIAYTEVADQLSSENIQVYPNPVTENLTLKINTSQSATIKYSVIDPLGRELYKFDQGVVSAGQKNYTIEFDDLNPGIYYISIEKGSERRLEKIILTK